jgi:hypothetical protein
MHRKAEEEPLAGLLATTTTQRRAAWAPDPAGLNLLVCLPDSVAHPGSAGTGAVRRPRTLAAYATAAGFAAAVPLPVEDTGFRRVYQLTLDGSAGGD